MQAAMVSADQKALTSRILHCHQRGFNTALIACSSNESSRQLVV